MSFKMFIIVSNRETQTKTTVKVHHIPIRMPKISKTNDNKNWRDVGKETVIHSWQDCNLSRHWKSLWIILEKLKIHLPHDPANSLDYAQRTHKENHTSKIKLFSTMFITALLTKARKSNQPKSLQPTGIMKTWSACYVILCSRGKNEIMNSASKWIELEKVTLSEFPDPEMQRSYVLSLETLMSQMSRYDCICISGGNCKNEVSKRDHCQGGEGGKGRVQGRVREINTGQGERSAK